MACVSFWFFFLIQFDPILVHNLNDAGAGESSQREILRTETLFLLKMATASSMVNFWNLFALKHERNQTIFSYERRLIPFHCRAHFDCGKYAKSVQDPVCQRSALLLMKWNNQIEKNVYTIELLNLIETESIGAVTTTIILNMAHPQSNSIPFPYALDTAVVVMYIEKLNTAHTHCFGQDNMNIFVIITSIGIDWTENREVRKEKGLLLATGLTGLSRRAYSRFVCLQYEYQHIVHNNLSEFCIQCSAQAYASSCLCQCGCDPCDTLGWKNSIHTNISISVDVLAEEVACRGRRLFA